jgi:3',5'-cyclic AMP phosphodiesterase CpdA
MTLLQRLLTTLTILAILAALIAGGWLWWRYRQHHPPIQDVPRRGGLDVTLWALSDLHFGSQVKGRDAKGRIAWIDAMPVRKRLDRQMRAVTGRPWPRDIGGTVGAASALLIAGDLTQDGKPSEWEQFATFYGLDQPAGPPVPIYELAGNHDEHTGSYVAQQIAARHGGKCYAVDFDDLHVANLGAGPDQADLDWLQRDLAATGCERPVILYMHYPLLGPWSGSWFGWNTTAAERFGAIIARFNIVAILHGHYHVPGRYQWRGIDVYNIGSIQHGARCFGVIRVTDDTFTFAEWNSELDGWWWWHSKPINAAKGSRSGLSGSSSSKGLLCAPAIPYPVNAK